MDKMHPSLSPLSSSAVKEKTGRNPLAREFLLSEEAAALGASRRTRRNDRGVGGCGVSYPGVSPPKKVRSGGETETARSATSAAKGTAAVAVPASAAAERGGKDDHWHLLRQLSQAIPAAGSLFHENISHSTEGGREGYTLDWDACNKALDRLVYSGGGVGARGEYGSSMSGSNSMKYDLFSCVKGDVEGDGMGDKVMDIGYEDEHSRGEDRLDVGVLEGRNVGINGIDVSMKGSKALDRMKERQRRELVEKKTLDLASQIVSRFKGARRPGVLRLLHRFFSCSGRRVRDPQDLERLVGACCYIIARQNGDSMNLHDVTGQLERRQGSRGRQRCRCISRWVVKVCGKVQLSDLPRHSDSEAVALHALHRICCYLKLLLSKQEKQEMMLLLQLKDAYRQCVLEEDMANKNTGCSNSANNNLQQQQLQPQEDEQQQGQQKDTSLEDLDDEDLLRLLLLQQQQNESPCAAANTAADAAADTAAAGAAGEDEGSCALVDDECSDVRAFLDQFDADCRGGRSLVDDDGENAEKEEEADEGIELLSRGRRVEGDEEEAVLQLCYLGDSNEKAKRARIEGCYSSGDEKDDKGDESTGDPDAIDAQIQQHECVLRLLRLLPSAQRIKLDHSIWLQRQRRIALKQLSEQSSLVVKCVGLLQQLSAAAAKNGGSTAAAAAAAASGSNSSSNKDMEDTDTPRRHTTPSTGHVEGENPLDKRWRACGRCDAVSMAAHFVIVFECLQVPVFQRVVLEALDVDRRSVYKRRREQLHLALSVFRRFSGGDIVTVKTLGALLIQAVRTPQMVEELLRLAESSPSPPLASSGEPHETLLDSHTSGRTAASHGVHCSAEESTEVSPATASPPLSAWKPSVACKGKSKDICDTETASSAAAAAALRELEEGDPVLSETPMARVVSLQFERTQQRWVCKWREGLGTGGRWHRRCFSVVKYGEDGAHTLAAAVAKRLRDRRNQEVSTSRQSSSTTPTSDVSPIPGEHNGPLKKIWKGGTGTSVDRVAVSVPSVKGRTRRNSPAASAIDRTSNASEGVPSYSFFDTPEDHQGDPLLSASPVDPTLSSVVASAAYSDEMERLAQLLQKARNNPLLAKWLDERAPPPGPAALRVAAESIVPYLAAQTATAGKAPSAASAAFRPPQEPLHRRGRVAGAREGGM